VLADKNRNLIYHLVKNQGVNAITKLISNTNIAERFNFETKRIAIILDFEKQSVFDIALQNSDFDSFNMLLASLI
jgi:hypothetical protein